MHVGHDDWEAVELINSNSLIEAEQFITAGYEDY